EDVDLPRHVAHVPEQRPVRRLSPGPERPARADARAGRGSLRADGRRRGRARGARPAGARVRPAEVGEWPSRPGGPPDRYVTLSLPFMPLAAWPRTVHLYGFEPAVSVTLSVPVLPGEM